MCAPHPQILLAVELLGLDGLVGGKL